MAGRFARGSQVWRCWPGGTTSYIGKAWCFGNLTEEPLVQDGLGYDENVQAPLTRGTGFACDGSQEDNITQTDGMTADVSFRAVQSRHNEEFVCTPPSEPEFGTLTVDKRIVFTDILVPGVVISDFTLNVTGPSAFDENFIDEIPWADLEPGTYTVTENYTGSEPIISTPVFGLDCNASGEVTLAAGDNKTCEITNEVEPDPQTTT